MYVFLAIFSHAVALIKLFLMSNCHKLPCLSLILFPHLLVLIFNIISDTVIIRPIIFKHNAIMYIFVIKHDIIFRSIIFPMGH
jgi:hypothetical protein